MDMAIAAASAGAALDPNYSKNKQANPVEEDIDLTMDGWIDLPNVNDIDVAAAAAAAAMEEQEPRVPKQRKVLSRLLSAHIDCREEDGGHCTLVINTIKEDDPDAEWEFDCEPYEEEIDEEGGRADGGDCDESSSVCSSEPDSVDLNDMKEIISKAYEQADDDDAEGSSVVSIEPDTVDLNDMKEIISKAYEQADDDDAEGSSVVSGEADSVDLNDMKEIISKAFEQADDDAAGGGGGGAEKTSFKDALGLPDLAPLDVEVLPNDVLEPAGSVFSYVEGMVVIQGPPNSRALKEGSVLVTDDKIPIGRVDEVFGPVIMPLYALRYALESNPYVKTTAKTPNDVAEAEDSDEEVFFSDDEQEAEYQEGTSVVEEGLPSDEGGGADEGRIPMGEGEEEDGEEGGGALDKAVHRTGAEGAKGKVTDTSPPPLPQSEQLGGAMPNTLLHPLLITHQPSHTLPVNPSTMHSQRRHLDSQLPLPALPPHQQCMATPRRGIRQSCSISQRISTAVQQYNTYLAGAWFFIVPEEVSKDISRKKSLDISQ
eukprot:gene28195-31291_t